MSDPNKNLSPPVQALLDGNLKNIAPGPPRRDLQREWAQKLDYCRKFDQSKMPAWRDPRAGR
jgi:hypothetical protein